jgi:hypothetical protein
MDTKRQDKQLRPTERQVSNADRHITLAVVALATGFVISAIQGDSAGIAASAGALVSVATVSAHRSERKGS